MFHFDTFVNDKMARDTGKHFWSHEAMGRTKEREAYIGRVRDARNSSGLKQEEIADALGIERPTYTNYEIRRPMPQKYIARFCEITNVNEKWLLTGLGPMKEDLWLKEQMERLAEIHESSREAFEQVLINWPKRS